jgi:hypothetical protein
MNANLSSGYIVPVFLCKTAFGYKYHIGMAV